MNNFMNGLELESKFVSYLGLNAQHWNTLVSSYTHAAIVTTSVSLTRESFMNLPILSVPFLDQESHALWGPKQASPYLINDIVSLFAYRLAFCSTDSTFLKSKQLPGGWKTSLDDYSWFITAVNANPSDNSGFHATRVVAKAGISSLASLLNEASKIDYNEYISKVLEFNE